MGDLNLSLGITDISSRLIVRVSPSLTSMYSSKSEGGTSFF